MTNGKSFLLLRNKSSSSSLRIGLTRNRPSPFRPRILIQPESQRKRRQEERRREEVRRRYSNRIKRPAEEERCDDASDAAIHLLHSHVEAAFSGSSHPRQ